MRQVFCVLAALAALAVAGSAHAGFIAAGYAPGNLGSPRGPDAYRLDDGVAESAIGTIEGGSMGWMTRYTVTPGNELITSIRIAFGTTLSLNGMPVTAYLWSDPNGDSNPADAVVLASAAGQVSGANPSVPINDPTFIEFDIPDTLVGPAGTSFFVGAIVNNLGDLHFPAAIDRTEPLPGPGITWGAVVFDGPINPSDLAAVDLLRDFHTVPHLHGKWLIRADATAIPEPGGLWLMALAGLAVLRRR